MALVCAAAVVAQSTFANGTCNCKQPDEVRDTMHCRRMEGLHKGCNFCCGWLFLEDMWNASLPKLQELGFSAPSRASQHPVLRLDYAGSHTYEYPLVSCDLHQSVLIRFLHVFKSGGETFLENFQLAQKARNRTLTGLSPRVSYTVTMVREPLDRFISGYTELMYRAWGNRNRADNNWIPNPRQRSQPMSWLYEGRLNEKMSTSWTSERIGSLGHAADFVKAWFGGWMNDGHVKLQVSSLFSAKSNGKFDIIGRVELMEQTYDAVRARLGCADAPDAFPRLSLDFRRHHIVNGSADFLGTTAAMRQVLSENPRLLTAAAHVVSRLSRSGLSVRACATDRSLVCLLGIGACPRSITKWRAHLE